MQERGQSYYYESRFKRELPHYDIPSRRWFGCKDMTDQEAASVGFATAHTTNDSKKRTCHRCGNRVNIYVSKPGSPYVWCTGCF